MKPHETPLPREDEPSLSDLSRSDSPGDPTPIIDALQAMTSNADTKLSKKQNKNAKTDEKEQKINKQKIKNANPTTNPTNLLTSTPNNQKIPTNNPPLIPTIDPTILKTPTSNPPYYSTSTPPGVETPLDLSLSMKIRKLENILSGDTSNFNAWCQELALLLEMGGLDTNTFWQLREDKSDVKLSNRSNAHIKVLILNSIDPEAPFLEKIRNMAYSPDVNSSISILQELTRIAFRALHTQVAILLNRLQLMKFKGDDLVTFNNQYMKLILKLSNTGEFNMDTSRKMNYIAALGDIPTASRLRLHYAEHGYHNATIQDIMDKALHIYSITKMSTKPTLAVLHQQASPADVSPPHTQQTSLTNTPTPDTQQKQCKRCNTGHIWGQCPYWVPRCRYCNDGSIHWANACPTIPKLGSRTSTPASTPVPKNTTNSNPKRKAACLQRTVFTLKPSSPGIIDSGAELTVTNDLSILENCSLYSEEVGTANKNYNVKLEKQGTISLDLPFGSITIPAFYSSEVSCTLISTEDLIGQGINVVFAKDGSYLTKDGIKHFLENNNTLPTSICSIRQIRFNSFPPPVAKLKKIILILPKTKNDWDLIHSQLSHCLGSDLQRTFNTSSPPQFDCSICNVANARKGSLVNRPQLFPHRIKSNMVYCDYKVLDNTNHLLLIITCKNWIKAYFQTSKSESEGNIYTFLNTFKDYIQFSCIVSDEDAPFNKRSFIKKVKKDFNLDILYVPPENHQHNYAEITIKTYMAMLRANYIASPKDLRDKYFNELVNHISFVKNRLGGRLSPFYKTFGYLFDISKLHRIFSDVTTIKLDRPNGLNEKGLSCKMLGYNLDYVTPTVTLLNEQTNRKIHRALVDCFNWSDSKHKMKIHKKGLTGDQFLHLFSKKLNAGFFKLQDKPISNINNMPEADKQLVRAVTSGFDIIKAPTRIRNVILHALLKETVNIFSHDVLRQLTPNEITHITKKIIKSSFVINVKRNGDIKARWVAAETDDIRLSTLDDYAATVSPILFKLISILCILYKLELISINFISAFLNGIINVETYISAPYPMNHYVFQVIGNMYGLKRAGKTWQELLIQILRELGLKQSIVDDCLFFFKTDLFLIFHVDDVLVAAKPKALYKFLNKLKLLFKIKINTQKTFDFLGVKFIITKENSIYLNQEEKIKSYTHDLLIEKIVPMPTKSTFSPYNDFKLEKVEENITPMKQLTGFLNYILKTRPDIAYYAANLSNLSNVANLRSLNAAIQSIQYLKSTKAFSLEYKKRKTYKGLLLETYVDASFRLHFTASCITFLNGNLLDWQAKVYKDLKVDSSCLAEAYALRLGSKRVKFLMNILDSINLQYFKPKFYTDNTGLYHFIHKNGSTKNIRSWDFEWHDFKAKFNEEFLLEHVKGQLNFADLLTKTLNSPRHYEITNKLLKDLEA